MPDPNPTSPWRRAAFCLLLAGAVLAVYWQAGRFDFTNYDDPDYVSHNRFVQMGLTAAGLRFALHNWFAWHPLTWLSHMLDCALFGVTPGAHHLVNVALHLANTLLLFLALARLTGAEGRSAFVAGLFGLHPLHVESVAWVAERKDVLSGLFWMLTLLAYGRYAARPGGARYLLVVLGFALGLMAKPMVVTLPCVLLLLDWWPLGRVRGGVGPAAADQAGPAGAANQRSPGRLVLEKAPLLALAGLASVVTVLYLKQWGRLDMEVYPFPVRLANALVSYARYLGKTILPEDLAVIYPHPGGWPGWAVAGACVWLGMVSVAAALLARARPYLLVGWLWFLGTLVPVLGLVQVNPQAMADRYTYLPLIGLFLALTWGVSDLAGRLAVPRPVRAGGAALVLAICALLSERQLRHWQNSITLFSHAVAVTADNPHARYNLAQALSTSAQALAARGRTTEATALLQAAIPHYEEALRLRPNYAAAHNNLGLTLASLGRPQEATNHYAQAARLNPKDDAVPYNHALALWALGRVEAARQQFEAALRLDPENPLTHAGLARLLQSQGQLDPAIAHYREAVRIHPAFAEARLALGEMLTAQGRLDEAVAHLTEAVRLIPDRPEPRAKLGLALAAQGRTREAISQYREALRLQPDQPEVLNNLAWLLATHPQAEVRDGLEAVQLAGRACELTGRKQPVLLGTLAAAYAEAGQFEQAASTAEEARKLALSIGQTNLAELNQRLARLYRQGQPWRQPRP